jgi:hypothetical protein
MSEIATTGQPSFKPGTSRLKIWGITICYFDALFQEWEISFTLQPDVVILK